MKLSGTRWGASNRSTVDNNDLGFGNKIRTGRLINRDGSFNVERRGHLSWTPYQDLVDMSWPRFLTLTGLAFVAVNAIFALLFLLVGENGFSGLQDRESFPLYWQLFFFSIQTFTTVGYGSMSPVGLTANIVAGLNAFVGLLGFALATGLLFARFAKPKAQVLFSKQAIIAPYRDGWSLQFRIVNLRSNNIINMEAKVNMSWLEPKADGSMARRFASLPLERSKVSLFPLNWTIVHPIDAQSPLYEKTAEDLYRMQVEILILISGYDDSFAQEIHDNGSYTAREMVWNACFEPMYFPEAGKTILELDKINAIRDSKPKLSSSVADFVKK
ncbi:MAG TPA: ion channel [Saprospiraceae bacterium]|nr:ion channel [Saprospiraceae bacterium]